jgi:hypothetical protein
MPTPGLRGRPPGNDYGLYQTLLDACQVHGDRLRETTTSRYRPAQADRKDRIQAIKSVMTPVWGYTSHEPHGYLTGDYPHGGVVTGERTGLQELAMRSVRFSLVAYTPRLREA